MSAYLMKTVGLESPILVHKVTILIEASVDPTNPIDRGFQFKGSNLRVTVIQKNKK